MGFICFFNFLIILLFVFYLLYDNIFVLLDIKWYYNNNRNKKNGENCIVCVKNKYNCVLENMFLRF